MSFDIEAGINNEETIPLVRIARGDPHSNEEKDEGLASRSEVRTSQCFNITRKDDDGKRQEIKSDAAGNETVESKMKYKIDICETRSKGTFKFIKMKTKSSVEEVAKDAEKFVEIAEFNQSTWYQILIGIDDAEKITESGLKLLRSVRESIYGGMMFLTNGLPHQILYGIDPSKKMKTVGVISTSFVTGTAATDSDHSKQYFGVVDFQNRREIGTMKQRCGKIAYALLLEDASPDDVMKYKLAILKAYSQVRPYCIKVITDGSNELLISMADNSYFADRRGVLLSENSGLFSSVLYSFVKAFRNGSEKVEQAEEEMKLVCQGYLSKKDRIDVVELIIENIKRNIGKFSTIRNNEEVDGENIESAVLHALVEGLDVPVNFVMNSSKAICDAISNTEYFKNNNTTLIFTKSGGIPYQLGNYLQDRERNDIIRCIIGNVKKTDDFYESVDQNLSKLKLFDADSPESNSMLASVTNYMENVLEGLKFSRLTTGAQSFSPLAISAVLRNNQPEIFKNWSCHQIAIDTYIFCNLRFHWHDKDTRGESKVAKHFGIVNENERRQPEWLHMGTAINKAIEKLSNGIIAKCFHEDGKPNVGIISPIQALIINRVFCMQLDFVKMLWKYDKENVLVNAVMIWILINGILKEKIFARENATDDLTKAKEYFAAAIKWPLDQLFIHFVVGSQYLGHRVPVFRGKPLYLVAVEGRLITFLTHIITKRCISAKWDNGLHHKIPNFINKPRIKLYIHMIMYAVSYLFLAYYTLQQKAKPSEVIKWVVLTMISSLFVDEMRQALGEREYPILISLRRWWSDGWNKIDFLTMMLYYLAFLLECAGVINVSRLLFSTFTFIWCLKFYQFLRAFESLGIYIILVQKMLPQLGNFAIVAAIAIISYGVFMTSILFPNISFTSWSVFIMVLLRPYLLLFAETGINEYDLSTKNTIYNTPKIETASEIMIVVGMCVFLMFGGVLLLNLLIAIFSGIYEEVKEESMKLWALNDLQLLQEFQRKPIVPIPFSIPVNIFLIFKRLWNKNQGYLFDDDCSDLVVGFIQVKLAESMAEFVENQETSSGLIIRRIDSEVTKLQEMYHLKNQDLKSLVESQHKNVKEMKEFLKESSKQMDKSAAKSEKHIEEVLNGHQETSLKVVDAVQESIMDNLGRHLEDSLYQHQRESREIILEKVDNATESLHTRVENVERRVEDLQMIIKANNKEIETVTIQCEEISAVLKQLVKSTQEKETR